MKIKILKFCIQLYPHLIQISFQHELVSEFKTQLPHLLRPLGGLLYS